MMKLSLMNLKLKKILRHRVKANGTVEFLTQWKGYPIEEATWEPPNHFFHRYSSDFVDYCQKKGMYPEILRLLQNKPHEE